MTDDEKIRQAHFIGDQIADLYVQQDNLLNEMCLKAIESKDPEVIRALLEKLPRGFHRTELRTFLHTLGV